MKKIVVFLWLIFLFSTVWSQPRPEKLSSTIVIDTDCGIDDLRAISLLLARPEITVRAILTSDGSLPPREGAEKVIALLAEFGKSNIPVICGKSVNGINPAWRQFNRSIKWGNQASSQKTESGCPEYLSKLLNNESEKITLVCLGSLTNIGEAMRKDAINLSKIDRIIWYNESENSLHGFNYECDKENANTVLTSNVRIDIISNCNKSKALFDTSMYAVCKESKTQPGRILNNVFTQPPVFEKLKENHFRLCDDLVVLYITDPELFIMNTGHNPNVRYNEDYDANGVKEAIIDMISGAYVSGHNVVFNGFPIQRELFNYDVRPVIDSAMVRYGFEELKANIMTDEFHGHLGVFSIVGVKMGIKARELFGMGVDMLEVTSYTGTKPPYSCLIDGIQVSTGATLGMGTIRLASESTIEPAAVFTYNGRSVRITLKKEYLEKVDADIKEGIAKFGLKDEGYWHLIRHNALKYWLEWDRNKIFDIVEVKQ